MRANNSDSAKIPTDEQAPPRYALNRKGGTHAMLVRLVPRSTRVLDVGCASGYLGQLLAAQGCTVVGIERDAEQAQVARSSGAYVAVYENDLDDTMPTLPLNGFDVILCGDVLEHLREPVGSLTRLRALLAHSGLLVVSLPNIAHATVRLQLLVGRFRYTDRGILDRTHLHFYTHESARAFIDSAGFQVESVLSGSDRFGQLLSFGPNAIRRLRGLLAYNIIVVARLK